MQLAIDTSTDTASLAIVQGSKVLAELTWRCDQNHTVELLPRLLKLLEQANLNLKSISAVIVARGPGSFNGLRVGISTAKGLAFGLKVPIVGISTLEVAAYQHAETGLPSCPIFNAGRGEIATAIYQKKGSQWRQLAAEHITTVEALCSQITTKTIFCGELTPAIAEQLTRKLKQKAIIPPPASRLRRASFLAELGLERLAAGSHDRPATLQPIYLRRPPITKPKRITHMAESRTGQSAIDTRQSNPENIVDNPESNTKAVIWDMDGVIVDSAPYHLKAWQEVLKKRRFNFTEEDFQRSFGQRNDTIIRGFLGKEVTSQEIAAISHEKETNFRHRIKQNLKPLPGVVSLMTALNENGFRMAIASSAPVKNIELVMSGLDVTGCCHVIISDKDVTEGKPSPQAFLLAARKLGANPKNCVVIEDAITGVAAAKRAGMHCLAVANSHPRESLKAADLIVDSLEEVTVSDIERLINLSREGAKGGGLPNKNLKGDEVNPVRFPNEVGKTIPE